ncbi:MAG: hypothetical protein EOP04_27135 [Proteobacteria bacterium]|nr:MAG: hypothetical protein EOP04_27135 [Pseudomonadota bacterium]
MKKYIAKVQKFLIVVFILVHGFLMVGGSLPDQSVAMSRAMDVLEPYHYFVGFHQGWSMFAPHPGGVNSYVDALVEYTDGSTGKWMYPRPSQMSAIDKSLAGEKYRKLGQEKLLPWQNIELWNDLSQYVIRELQVASPGKKVATIQFYRHTNIVKPPQVLFVSHGQPAKTYATDGIFQYKLPVELSYDTQIHQ